MQFRAEGGEDCLIGGGDLWKRLFPGRYILQKFANQYGMGDWPVLQNLIIDRLAKGDLPIDAELHDIFDEIAR